MWETDLQDLTSRLTVWHFTFFTFLPNYSSLLMLIASNCKYNPYLHYSQIMEFVMHWHLSVTKLTWIVLLVVEKRLLGFICSFSNHQTQTASNILQSCEDLSKWSQVQIIIVITEVIVLVKYFLVKTVVLSYMSDISGEMDLSLL